MHLNGLMIQRKEEAMIEVIYGKRKKGMEKRVKVKGTRVKLEEAQILRHQ